MAQTSIRVNGARHAFAFEQITVDNTAGGKGATAATAFPRVISGGSSFDHGAEEAFISIETDQVRYTLDGTAPTSSLGHILEAGDILQLIGRDMIVKLRMIRVTTNAAVSVTYFRD